MSNKPLQFSIRADLDLAAKTGETERVLEIEIQAPVAAQQGERPPLNLGIVLDRSGSMSGAKLKHVKEAGAHLLDLLEERDRAALVVYDNQVNVLSKSVPMTEGNRKELKASLGQVRSGNTTFLSGGWAAGCKEAAETAGENSLNRVLLLTDGLANVGVTDEEELAHQSKELFTRGISTSTFGVGSDFNEHILEAMANQGGGNFHFIEGPQDIPNIFQREFKELAAVTARDVEVTLELPAQVKAHVLGGWQAERTGDQLRISLGSMYSGHKQLVYVKLTIPAGDADELVIHGLGRGKGEAGSLLEARAQVTFKYVAKEEVDKAIPQADLLERYASVDLADAASEALRMDREGRQQEALSHLQTVADRNRSYASAPRMSLHEDLQGDMSRGMSEAERKRSHYDQYSLKQMRDAREEFVLHQPGGHVVIEVDGKMALVDTGSPVSVGRQDRLYFLGKEYPLLPSFQHVVTLDFLSQKVGVQLDVLMGMDILGECYFMLDGRHRMATFSREPLRWRAFHRIPMREFMMKVPVTRLVINGKPLDVFVDTGAVRCYVPKELVNGCRQVGTERDFFPGAPDFDTKVFEVPADLAGERMTLECGVDLPAVLEQGLQAAGVRGILGMDLLRRYRVGFAMPEKQLVLIDSY